MAPQTASVSVWGPVGHMDRGCLRGHGSCPGRLLKERTFEVRL
jgi:hypothetical protein